MVLDNVPYFDPVREETVDVNYIVGGASGLQNEIELTRTLGVTASPLPKYNLQLSAQYQQVELRNELGALPEASTAVLNAFPDRFIRDANGQLITVDTRSINFADENTKQLSLGIGFSIPLMAARTVPRSPTAPMRRVPPVLLQFNLYHTIILDSSLLIRSGLPTVDLLSGGAIGITGRKLRNISNASLALTRGSSGFRLNATYRGPSYLQVGTTAAPDRLTFDSIFKFDLRAFAELGQLMPGNRMARNTRLSLAIENVLGNRQGVTNLAGITPQAYQPAFRDPIGRTVMLELRKVL